MSIKKTPHIVSHNAWQSLNRFTDARIGLGRAGVSLPTSALLEFQLAHAQAQDAVHTPLDVNALNTALASLSQTFELAKPIFTHSRATDRQAYLQRPDLGRRLALDASEQLHQTNSHSNSVDLAIVIVDGLSSLAISTNTVPFLTELLTALKQDSADWSIAPLTVVQQGRVAIGDEVGEKLNAHAVLVLIGERPGLSSPDSLGLYLTWSPKVGLTDANRNCISNVRQAGLIYTDAVRKAMYLLKESRSRQLTGVKLKERSETPVFGSSNQHHNFLIPELTQQPKKGDYHE